MDFEDLYQEIILDHYRNPRNFGETTNNSVTVEHDNPVCGDHIKLMVHVNGDGRIDDIKFSGNGCAISMSSASMMTEEVKGKTFKEAETAIKDIIATLRGEQDSDILANYGDLTALKGVVKFPVRVKCATLSWHALEDALQKKNIESIEK